MVRISELRMKDRAFLSVYQFRTLPWQAAALKKPLKKAKVAVISTAAFYLPSQQPFDQKKKGGDYSFRVIKRDADLPSLRVGHRSLSFDHRGIEQDANLALPLERLHELEQKDEVGSVANTHYSFMGSITAPARLIRESAPKVAAMLKDEGVDAVLLIPV